MLQKQLKLQTQDHSPFQRVNYSSAYARLENEEMIAYRKREVPSMLVEPAFDMLGEGAVRNAEQVVCRPIDPHSISELSIHIFVGEVEQIVDVVEQIEAQLRFNLLHLRSQRKEATETVSTHINLTNYSSHPRRT